MRFQINVDCSPEEAREFFGLPDILPMQQNLMEMVSRRLSENIQTMAPEDLMKTWVPALFQGWSDVQSNFWNQFSQMGGEINKNMGKHKMDFTFNQSPKPKEGEEDKNDYKPSPSRKKKK